MRSRMTQAFHQTLAARNGQTVPQADPLTVACEAYNEIQLAEENLGWTIESLRVAESFPDDAMLPAMEDAGEGSLTTSDKTSTLTKIAAKIKEIIAHIVALAKKFYGAIMQALQNLGDRLRHSDFAAKVKKATTSGHVAQVTFTVPEFTASWVGDNLQGKPISQTLKVTEAEAGATKISNAMTFLGGVISTAQSHRLVGYLDQLGKGLEEISCPTGPERRVWSVRDTTWKEDAHGDDGSGPAKGRDAVSLALVLFRNSLRVRETASVSKSMEATFVPSQLASLHQDLDKATVAITSVAKDMGRLFEQVDREFKTPSGGADSQSLLIRHESVMLVAKVNSIVMREIRSYHQALMVYRQVLVVALDHAAGEMLRKTSPGKQVDADFSDASWLR